MATISWQASLDIVKAQKLMNLGGSFNATLASGFTSSADGTSRNYPLDSNNMIKWSGAMSIVDTNTVTNPLIIKDVNGVQVSVTADQFKTLATDGFSFFMQQEQKLWQLEAQVEAVTVQNGDVQTAINQVNAITW